MRSLFSFFLNVYYKVTRYISKINKQNKKKQKKQHQQQQQQQPQKHANVYLYL